MSLRGMEVDLNFILRQWKATGGVLAEGHASICLYKQLLWMLDELEWLEIALWFFEWVFLGFFVCFSERRLS